ncbi:MAG: polysaccharide biosynthesis/export family protein [Prosthecobacter sp.]
MICSILLTPLANGDNAESPLGKNAPTSIEDLDDQKRLKPGYVISMRIVEDKREAIQQLVATTGEVHAPYLGSVKAEGLTCCELALKLKIELEKTYFKHATVLITLDATENPPKRFVCPILPPSITAFGSLAKQGIFDLSNIPDQRLSGLFQLAGGHTSHRKIPKIRIIRKTPQGNRHILVNAKEVLFRKNSDYDLYLRQGDVIIVE